MATQKEIQFKIVVDGKEATATFSSLEDAVKSLGGSTELATSKAGDGLDSFATKALALNQTLQALKASKEILNSTFGEAIELYNQTVQSTLKLNAAAKIAGIELGTLTSISARTKEEFALSERVSNEFTISLSKLTGKAGDVSQTSTAIKNLLNVAAAQGLNPDQALVAIDQAILGIDEGTDKLFQKNPSVIYQEFAASIGTTAGMLTDQQKAQAMVNELQNVSIKVGDTYIDYLDSEAGKQAEFNARLEETQVAIGKVVRSIAGPFLQAGKSWLEVFNALPDSLQGTIGSMALLLVSLKALQSTGIIPNLGLLASLRTQLLAVVAAMQAGTGATGVFTAGMAAATTSIRAFFASIPIAGWIALLLSALPLLWDFAKGWLGIGESVEDADTHLQEFTNNLKKASRFEIETNIAETSARITALDSVIASLQERLLVSRDLSRKDRAETTGMIKEYQQLVAGFRQEVDLLEERLIQLDNAQPGEEGFRSLSERIKETEAELVTIAEMSVDGLIPNSEIERAKKLKEDLNELRQMRDRLFKDLGLTAIEIPIKPEVEPIAPKDIILEDDFPNIDIELDVKLPWQNIKQQFRDGILLSIDDVNNALAALQEQFNSTDSDQTRRSIQAVMNDLNLFKGQLDGSGASVDEFRLQLSSGVIASIEQLDDALRELNAQLSLPNLSTEKQKELSDFITQLEPLKEKLLEVSTQIELDFGPVITQTLNDVGGALGELLAGGTESTANFGLAIQGALAGAMKSIGSMILSLGVGAIKVMASPNPLTWISAGLALIAAGSYIGARVNTQMRKSMTSAQSTEPARQRFDGYADGGIVEGNKIIEVGEQGPEMILTAPATKKLRPFFNELNAGLLPTIPVGVGHQTQNVNSNINLEIAGGFRVSGSDLISVIDKRLRIEKALGREVLK